MVWNTLVGMTFCVQDVNKIYSNYIETTHKMWITIKKYDDGKTIEYLKNICRKPYLHSSANFYFYKIKLMFIIQVSGENLFLSGLHSIPQTHAASGSSKISCTCLI
jgi:hypothetical protein